MHDILKNNNFNNNWLNSIHADNFESKTLGVFRFQYQNNELYRTYVDSLNVNPHKVFSIPDIPFLPIRFFKTHQIATTTFTPELVFESSGTTSTQNSKHYVKHSALYQTSFINTFRKQYGSPENYVFLCLLPSYLERKNSSLVYMANELIAQSRYRESGFFLNDWNRLASVLQYFSDKNDNVILLGVTFALLDFAEAFPMDLNRIIIMETGGMKGRKEEWTRKRVHDFLKEKWNLPIVHSEYGMTELLSQAYAKQDGVFVPADYLKALVREEFDPLTTLNEGRGVLNFIDLANVYSCSFIATEDLGKVNTGGTFEVYGRMDNTALRGCSLMAL